MHCHSLFHGIFLSQGSNLSLLHLLWQAGSLSLALPGNLPAMWDACIQSLGQEDPLRKWLLTPVFLSREFQIQRNQAGYSLCIFGKWERRIISESTGSKALKGANKWWFCVLIHFHVLYIYLNKSGDKSQALYLLDPLIYIIPFLNIHYHLDCSIIMVKALCLCMCVMHVIWLPSFILLMFYL